MQIRVKYAGTEYDLPAAGPADLVAFERQFKVSSTALGDAERVQFEWICFLVYRGLKKVNALSPDDSVNGLTSAGLSESFLERIEELVMPDADDEESDDADPTVPAAPLG